MTPTDGTTISAAVEGVVDEAVARRLIEHVGGTAGPVYGKFGKVYLKEKIRGYNNAAAHALWFVLVDLNNETHCAPLLKKSWLPSPAPHMCFRIAVREVEAWLLADHAGLSAFLQAPVSKVPRDPENVKHPKSAIVQLARSSRSREIQEDMVPRPESARAVGPAYPSRLIEFITSANSRLRWRPDVAARQSDSLKRCLCGLEYLVMRANPAKP